MNRKSLIESHGATCKNWTWSWSFVNHKARIVIFGAWDINTSSKRALIFSDSWRLTERGRKAAAFEQSQEHIRLIEEEGYTLQTFRMEHSDANKDENGFGPAKIGGFRPQLENKTLKREKGKWYAV